MFLDPRAVAWERDPAYAMWAAGEVVTAIDDVLPAIARAPAAHRRYAEFQHDFAADALGDTSGAAAARAAAVILDALERRKPPDS